MVGGFGSRLARGSRRCARLAAFWLTATAAGGLVAVSADCRKHEVVPSAK
jgi:hypothetical protein